MLVLILYILAATILLLINMNKVLHPVEIVLYWMINAMINEEFILITIANLKVIKMPNEPIPAITLLISKIYLMLMLSLCFLTYFLIFQTTISRIILISISVLVHTSCLYINEWLGLVNLIHWSYDLTIIFWGAVLFVNLFLLFGYRKLLRRVGIVNESINNA